MRAAITRSDESDTIASNEVAFFRSDLLMAQIGLPTPQPTNDSTVVRNFLSALGATPLLKVDREFSNASLNNFSSTQFGRLPGRSVSEFSKSHNRQGKPPSPLAAGTRFQSETAWGAVTMVWGQHHRNKLCDDFLTG